MSFREDLEKLVDGSCPDPHAVLGAFLVDGSLVVRVFRPSATEVIFLPQLSSLKPRRMARIHPAGIFQVSIPDVDVVVPYRIEVRSGRRSVVSWDPYVFSPSNGESAFEPGAPGAYRDWSRRLGAFVSEVRGIRGTFFAVWAPRALRVSVVGDFNRWDGRRHAMRRTPYGVWEIFAPDVVEGAEYKYEIKTPDGIVILKNDPQANGNDRRPESHSKVVSQSYQFQDGAWIKAREAADIQKRPMSIYEVHLGSFRRKAGAWKTYRELAVELVDHVVDLGFTHIELLPVMEHPFDGSWGYQVTGYFAPTARFGDPDDLRYFVDRCHERGLGVLFDWPPAHFPKDAYALGRFDGTPVYEHADPQLAEHREWKTFVFDYGKPEVKNFLIASALYWLHSFHADGLRVDAVASMLYLDYGARSDDEWTPNRLGGRENLEAITFLRELSDAAHEVFPGIVLCAEESTTFPGVTKKTVEGGLGFDLKWNMGWMHDTLDYFTLDPIFRAHHHGKLTFGMMYAYSEKFLLPLSHDEVVHLKRSLLSKMFGDRWKKHAGLRSLYAYMWAHPGKKLLFMGGEIGQWSEWNHDAALDFHLTEEKDHAGLGLLLRDLNQVYKRYEALWELDASPAGFTWIDPDDAGLSVASFVRFPKQPDGSEEPCPKRIEKGIFVVFVGNFTPVPRNGYRIGVPRRCRYLEVLNTDAEGYGGSGKGNMGSVEVEEIPSHGFPQSIVLTLPPLGALYLVPEAEAEAVTEAGAGAEAGADAGAGAGAEAGADADAGVGAEARGLGDGVGMGKDCFNPGLSISSQFGLGDVGNSLEDLIGIVYQYYPRNVLSTEPHLGTSMEYQRLIAARKRAGADKSTWQVLLKRIGEQFPGQLVQDHSLGLLGGGYGASYYAELYLPESQGKYEHSIGFAVSFLVPYYALFSSRFVERVRQQRLYTEPPARVAFEGDTCVILPGDGNLAQGSTDGVEMEKHREFSFSFTIDELRYAEFLGREIELLFGCQKLPPELASVIVPDISTSLRDFGQATIFDCLFSDQY